MVPLYVTLPLKAGIHVQGTLNIGQINIASPTVAHVASGADENDASLTEQGTNVWFSGGPSLTGTAKLSAALGIQGGIGIADGANVHLSRLTSAPRSRGTRGRAATSYSILGR